MGVKAMFADAFTSAISLYGETIFLSAFRRALRGSVCAIRTYFTGVMMPITYTTFKLLAAADKMGGHE